MCGILGYIFNNNYKLSEEEFKENLKILKKRGPNFSDQVTLNDNNYKLYLGHTRLSIIELSNIANQPFKDSENILVFNGEMYNCPVENDTAWLGEGMDRYGIRFLEYNNWHGAVAYYIASWVIYHSYDGSNWTILSIFSIGSHPLF